MTRWYSFSILPPSTHYTDGASDASHPDPSPDPSPRPARGGGRLGTPLLVLLRRPARRGVRQRRWQRHERSDLCGRRRHRRYDDQPARLARGHPLGAIRARCPRGIRAVTAIEYWIENYAAKGGKEKSVAPNAMWQKRPRGQLAKCASAQALRIAFPEIASQQTAEEMEGKHIIDMGPAKTTPAEIAAAALPQPAERTDELNNIIFNLEMVAKSEGATALAEEWSMLTKEQRKAIGQDELKRLKELAGEGRANEGGDGDE
ncbi:recombinase RecT [Cupriavidus gilardii]|uniref:recombinase RecT n=1 Tax=Cupriavidus gilardii TaxID=82541 RepID=UPI0009EBCD54|nr:recombinase RecT [Cupriavidus gilardii]MCT9017029.1 recombinase RecT [Cupriavidus gilardii]MCT9056702.1 recombinase RecT [Cupriavidus gilardii]